MTNNKGAVEVEVQPNVDYAFIVALLTIVDEIDYFKLDNTLKAAGKVAKGVVQGISICATVEPLVNE